MAPKMDGRPLSNPWTRFALLRLRGLAIVLISLLLVTFLIIRLIPGDPGRRIAGRDATPEQVEQVRESLGLNKSLPLQFVDYVGKVIRLDFGKSFATGEPVRKTIADRLPNTAKLAGVSVLLILLVSIPLGILMGVATRDGRAPKLGLLFTAVTGASGALPEFLMATFLAFVFAVWLRWLPAAGASRWSSIILPALAISLRSIATLSHMIRMETLGVLAQDYMRTARSKRLPVRLIYFRHAMPNVMTVALTTAGLLLSGLLGGAMVVENVFAWPGLGTAVVQAVLVRDYPVVQGIVLLLGTMVVLINTVVDLAVGLIDPRSLIRQS